MNSKLADKLISYEERNPITTDEEKIRAIEQILEAEEALPAQDRDYDLIDEAVETILHLKGVDVDQVNQRARKLADAHLKTVMAEPEIKPMVMPRRAIRTRWVLPVAAVLVIMVAGTAVAKSLGYDLVAITKNVYMVLTEHIWHSDGTKDIIVTGDYGEYKTYEELKTSEEFSDLLWPKEMPDNSTLERVLVEDYGSYREITLYMTSESNVQMMVIRTPLEYTQPELESAEIGAYNVYTSQYDNKYQGEFAHAGDVYLIAASSYEALEEMILSLE